MVIEVVVGLIQLLLLFPGWLVEVVFCWMNGVCWGEDGGCDRDRDVGCCGIVLTVLCGVFFYL